MKPREIIVAYNASGAARAAQEGYAVLIVDVIDMSTSLEAALEAGAVQVFGASPDVTRAPVQLDPARIGYEAGIKAKGLGTQMVLITEPRWGREEDRQKNCQQVIKGIEKAGSQIQAILPNLGAEIGKAKELTNKVVICVSDTGGVAYDAAYQYTDKIATGTIARTLGKRGIEPAQTAARRIMDLAAGQSIAIIAASSNSLEDVLAANYISQLIIGTGYLTK